MMETLVSYRTDVASPRVHLPAICTHDAAVPRHPSSLSSLLHPCPSLQVMCMCPDQKVGRQLILHRGLHPVVLDEADSPASQAEAVELAKNAGFCKAGDTVLVAYRDHASPAKDLALKILIVRKGGRIKRMWFMFAKSTLVVWRGFMYPTSCFFRRFSHLSLLHTPGMRPELSRAFDPPVANRIAPTSPLVAAPTRTAPALLGIALSFFDPPYLPTYRHRFLQQVRE